MKKMTLGSLAVATIIGIGGAFATSHNSHTLSGGAVYYSYYDDNGNLRWTTNSPSSTCISSPLACTITSTSDNVTLLVNVFPAQKTILNGSDGKSYSSL